MHILSQVDPSHPLICDELENVALDLCLDSAGSPEEHFRMLLGAECFTASPTWALGGNPAIGGAGGGGVWHIEDDASEGGW